MKSDYRIRAKKFLKSIFPYIDGYMWDVDDVMYQVEVRTGKQESSQNLNLTIR